MIDITKKELKKIIKEVNKEQKELVKEYLNHTWEIRSDKKPKCLYCGKIDEERLLPAEECPVKVKIEK